MSLRGTAARVRVTLFRLWLTWVALPGNSDSGDSRPRAVTVRCQCSCNASGASSTPLALARGPAQGRQGGLGQVSLPVAEWS
jgi:hypothetical protein